MVIEDFALLFEGKLSANNRWAKLANIIPWEQIERDYADLFPSSTGTVAKPLLMALGSLIIKERCGFTDRETVEHITEKPYLQYFIGLEKYQLEPSFDPSLMVFFRKRLDRDIIKKINEMIAKPKATKRKRTKIQALLQVVVIILKYDSLKSINKGKLLLDATCAPADIKYPTDLSLLNEAREPR